MGFQIREYGRAELAQAYSPNIAPMSAWKRLKTWIGRFPGLEERLRQVGYDGNQRNFTPQQVQAIVDALGEP